MTRKTALLMIGTALLFFGTRTAFSQQAQTGCTPGISYWKLLEAIGVGYTDGKLRMDAMYAVCLPTPEKQSDSNYPYDPDTGGKLSTIVKRTDGTVLNTYVWYARNSVGLWELNGYKVVGGHEAVKPLAAGDYVLEFAMGDRPFYRFPFSVVEMKSDDPYMPPGARYFIEGAWNDYGNIFYQRNDPESSFRFTTWLQEKSGRETKRSVSYEVKVVRERDGKMLAEDAGTLRLETRWLKVDFLLRPAGGDKNAYFKVGEVLREDGGYSVRFALDDKPYGRYPFNVKGNRIQFQGRQIRENTDPMRYIVDYLYGGHYTSWWIQREGATR